MKAWKILKTTRLQPKGHNLEWMFWVATESTISLAKRGYSERQDDVKVLSKRFWLNINVVNLSNRSIKPSMSNFSRAEAEKTSKKGRAPLNHWTKIPWRLGRREEREERQRLQNMTRLSGGTTSWWTKHSILRVRRRLSWSAVVKEKSARIIDFWSRGIPYEEGTNMSTKVAINEENSEIAEIRADMSPRLTSGQCLWNTEMIS